MPTEMAELPLCSVCCDVLGRYSGPSTLPCGHNGCLDCFRDVQKRQPFCPLCRSPFDPALQLVVNHELKELMAAAASSSMMLDDGTAADGWEAFPSAQLTAQAYAAEVAAADRSQGPLGALLSGDACIAGAQQYRPGGRQQQQRGSGLSSLGSSSSLPPSAPSSTQRDILLLDPPLWTPDSAASHCTGCQAPFKPLMRLRHHCRLCGKVFCHACSAQQLLLPPRFKERDPQRVCGMCAGLLLPLQPFLIGAASASVQPPVHDALDAISLRSWLNRPWGNALADELFKAANILNTFTHARRLEPEAGWQASLLTGVRGLALLSVVRVGAGWCATAGTGVVVARQHAGWSAPCAVACYGFGWGLQLGGELTDVLLVLRTDEAVRAFAAGHYLGVGASAGLALGPLGRAAQAGVRLGSSAARGAAVAYCCSRGAFAGVSLDGSVTLVRHAVNQRFYGYAVTPRQLLVDGAVPQPPAAALLYSALDDLMGRWQGRRLLTAASAASASPGKQASSSCSKAASGKQASSSCSKQQQLQQQQRFSEAGEDDDVLLAAAEEFDDVGRLSPVASAPPAPAPPLLRGFAAGGRHHAWQQQAQQQQQQQQQPQRRSWRQATAPVAAEPAVMQQQEEEEPQYVLEW